MVESASTDDQVVIGDVGEQTEQVLRIVLAVGIHAGYDFAEGRSHAGLYGSAIPLVVGMSDDAQHMRWALLSEFAQDRGGAVSRAIIDYDDLEAPTPTGQHLHEALNGGSYDLTFLVHRHYD